MAWSQNLGEGINFGPKFSGEQWVDEREILEREMWTEGRKLCFVKCLYDPNTKVSHLFPPNKDHLTSFRFLQITLSMKSAIEGSMFEEFKEMIFGSDDRNTDTEGQFKLFLRPYLGEEPIIISENASIRDIERALKLLWPSSPAKVSIHTGGVVAKSIKHMLGKKGVHLNVDGIEFPFNEGNVINDPEAFHTKKSGE